jgi:hypothetical protein
MIEREIERDIQDGVVDYDDDKLSVVDYGSNYGYFSIHMAKKFPKGTVVSLEGESYSGIILFLVIIT